MPDIPRLDYAPPPPIHRRRSFRRWVYATVLLGVAISGWWWAPPAWRRVELLYWQHECMVYIPPTEVSMEFSQDRSISIVPPQWEHFYSQFSPPGDVCLATAFMHELRNTHGQRRLVVVQILYGMTGIPPYNAYARVFSPGDILNKPKIVYEGWIFSGFRYAQETTGCDVTLFAGHIDPDDSSHFTIRSKVEGKEFNYDGWLQNDDTVILGERKSPATQVAPDVHPGLENTR